MGHPSKLYGSKSSLKISPFSNFFLFIGILALYSLVAYEKHLSSHPGVKSSANPSQSTFVQPVRIFDSRTVIHCQPANLFVKFFGLGLVIFWCPVLLWTAGLNFWSLYWSVYSLLDILWVAFIHLCFVWFWRISLFLWVSFNYKACVFFRIV